VGTIKLFEKKKKVKWEYDEEADVLYLSFGSPKHAIGVDVGEGIILRYDEMKKEIVELTSLRKVQNRLDQSLTNFLRERAKV